MELIEFRELVKEAFVKMDEAIKPDRAIMNGFGRGFDMQRHAVDAAPEWLMAWYEENRWTLCFTQGFKGFVTIAGAMGVEEVDLMKDLKRYYDMTNGD